MSNQQAIDPATQNAIDESVERAVEKVFAIMGVDIRSPQSVSDFQEDLRFGRGLRRAKERGLLAMATAIGAALVFAVWQGILYLVQTGR